MAAVARRTMSLSVPVDLVESMDEWAKAANMTRSAYFSGLLAQERRRRLEDELAEEYRALAEEEGCADIEWMVPLFAEVIRVDSE